MEMKKELAEKWEEVKNDIHLWWIDIRIKFFERYDECQKRRNYTKKHQRAFLEVEKEVRGYNTFRGCIHDWDKLILYWGLLFGLTAKQVQKIHRFFSWHHDNWMNKTEDDYENMVLDWESSQRTKPDKPLHAFATMFRFYPKLEDKVMPAMARLHLLTEKAINQAVEEKLVTAEKAAELVKKYS